MNKKLSRFPIGKKHKLATQVQTLLCSSADLSFQFLERENASVLCRFYFRSISLSPFHSLSLSFLFILSSICLKFSVPLWRKENLKFTIVMVMRNKGRCKTRWRRRRRWYLVAKQSTYMNWRYEEGGVNVLLLVLTKSLDKGHGIIQLC